MFEVYSLYLRPGDVRPQEWWMTNWQRLAKKWSWRYRGTITEFAWEQWRKSRKTSGQPVFRPILHSASLWMRPTRHVWPDKYLCHCLKLWINEENHVKHQDSGCFDRYYIRHPSECAQLDTFDQTNTCATAWNQTLMPCSSRQYSPHWHCLNNAGSSVVIVPNTKFNSSTRNTTLCHIQLPASHLSRYKS